MRFTFVVILFLFSLIQEGATVPKPGENPEWYEKVVGVIGIPAAVIGCAYEYLLIKKTRLESQKIDSNFGNKNLLAVQHILWPKSDGHRHSGAIY